MSETSVSVDEAAEEEEEVMDASGSEVISVQEEAARQYKPQIGSLENSFTPESKILSSEHRNQIKHIYSHEKKSGSVSVRTTPDDTDGGTGALSCF